MLMSVSHCVMERVTSREGLQQYHVICESSTSCEICFCTVLLQLANILQVFIVGRIIYWFQHNKRQLCLIVCSFRAIEKGSRSGRLMQPFFRFVIEFLLYQHKYVHPDDLFPTNLYVIACTVSQTLFFHLKAHTQKRDNIKQNKTKKMLKSPKSLVVRLHVPVLSCPSVNVRP